MNVSMPPAVTAKKFLSKRSCEFRDCTSAPANTRSNSLLLMSERCRLVVNSPAGVSLRYGPRQPGPQGGMQGGSGGSTGSSSRACKPLRYEMGLLPLSPTERAFVKATRRATRAKSVRYDHGEGAIVEDLERTREGTRRRALDESHRMKGGLKGGINHNESHKCSIPTIGIETRTFSSLPKIAKRK